MIVKVIATEIGFTKNMGNFESYKISFSFEAELEPGEHPEAAAAILRRKARDQVRLEILRLDDAAQADADEIHIDKEDGK